MKSYKALVNRVIANGTVRPSRVGDTVQVFGETFEHDMGTGFPILTTRQMSWLGVIGELCAFLEGSRSLARFKALGCNYWEADAARWGKGDDLGRIYGVQWRNWNGKTDQWQALIDGLTSDPFGRRHLLTAWNPSELPEMCLPPCHIFAQFNVGKSAVCNRLDCQVYMRSVDLCLGLPSDLVLYGALLEALACHLNMEAGILRFVFGDCHVYLNHVESWNFQVLRSPTRLPCMEVNPNIDIFNVQPTDFRLHEYQSQSAIKYRLNT